MTKESGVFLCSKFILIVFSSVATPPPPASYFIYLGISFLNIIKLFSEMLNLLTFIFPVISATYFILENL